MAGVAQHHDALQGGQLRRQLLQQRQEHGVGEQVAILGVVHDVGDLIREQAGIDGVTDGADPGDAVVQLEVPVVVPGERGDALACWTPSLSWSALASCLARWQRVA